MTSRLADLLDGFDVPAMRRDITRQENLWWLLRNLPIRNSRDHAGLAEAMTLIREMLV